ncbi:hypothetical protein [Plantibacter sp. ME-Dv--P-122b]|uniref:hypothetical protein n=1 Tax=Plantibacter sp. ME-Dv--P-122b TaxID=3040300 RepID=UPI0025507499|nr:hypothetical protein [Plantibacter sp. ME-Dv--P-122b]
MAQELIWLTLLALAVVVVLAGWMKYLRKPTWSGRPFGILVLTSLPTLVLLVVGALSVVSEWPILPAIAPLLLFFGALLQVVHAADDSEKLGDDGRDALALAGWIAVLFGAGWAAVDALI